MKFKPIIKWVGGKTKLLSYIIDNIPLKFNNYYEPFIGGGSVFIELKSSELGSSKKYIISDINNKLINCYNIVKYNLDELLIELKRDEYVNKLDNYLANRARFNKLSTVSVSVSERVENAALFIYLNKCGYNGMYRENKSGEYNIPFGRMNNPNIIDAIVLNNFKNLISDTNTEIKCMHYDVILESVKENDFVYLDPPYHNTFSDYNKTKFKDDEQEKLKLFMDKLTEKKVNVMISNSDTEFIKNLYKDYNIINLTTKYSIGGKGAKRSNTSEVLIMNYKK